MWTTCQPLSLRSAQLRTSIWESKKNGIRSTFRLSRFIKRLLVQHLVSS